MCHLPWFFSENMAFDLIFVCVNTYTQCKPLLSSRFNKNYFAAA